MREKSLYLIVGRESCGVSVIGTQDQMLHYTFYAGIYIPRHIAGAQIPGDEFIGNRHHVAVVRCQAKTEYRELMTFQ